MCVRNTRTGQAYSHKWSSFFGIFHTRESKSYTVDPTNGMLHFLLYEQEKAIMDSFAKHPYIFLRKDGYYIDIPKNITTLAEGSFIGANITTVIVPDNISTIGKGAFLGSAVSNVILPERLTVIADDAFTACLNLRKIYLPASLTTLGARTFMGCQNLECITIPENVQKVGDEAFAFCRNLQKVTLPEQKIHFGENVFYGCPRNWSSDQ